MRSHLSYLSPSFSNATIALPVDGTGGPGNTATYSVHDEAGGAELPPNAPGNPDPANGATEVSTDPMLSWDAVVDETGLTSTSRDVSGLDEATQYFWRTRGANAGGAGLWSAAQSFTTVDG